MFAHLKGGIEKISADHMIIDVNGVGYFVFASRLTLSNVTAGETIKLHIETLMRQESLQLFGFLGEEELSWFRLLLAVQGVGPKVALGIMGSLGLKDLSEAIIHQDKAMLNRADGVGPKLASRILLELKDKLKTLEIPQVGFQTSLKESLTPAMDDALAALISLGYTRFEAHTALGSLEKDDVLRSDSASLIRFALQSMQHRKAL